MSAGDARLRLLADRFRGMKPPKFPTMFEAVVNAFACQQLSLEVGLELLNRLATVSGVRFGTVANPRYAFPTPSDVAKLRPEKCRAAGSAIRRSAHSLTLPEQSLDGTWIWRHWRAKATLWSGNACLNCAASDAGRPSTCS
jgi:DNA-3-methyladenine glycosylase II